MSEENETQKLPTPECLTIVDSLPYYLQKAMVRSRVENGVQAWVVGGYIRDTLLGVSKPKDIDVCVPGPQELQAFNCVLDEELSKNPDRDRNVDVEHQTDNRRLITFKGYPDLPIDTFCYTGVNSIMDICGSVDFSINSVAIEFDGRDFRGVCHPHFLEDLKNKKLNYIRGDRFPEGPRILKRYVKFLQMGYAPYDGFTNVRIVIRFMLSLEQVLKQPVLAPRPDGGDWDEKSLLELFNNKENVSFFYDATDE